MSLLDTEAQHTDLDWYGENDALPGDSGDLKCPIKKMTRILLMACHTDEIIDVPPRGIFVLFYPKPYTSQMYMSRMLTKINYPEVINDVSINRECIL